MFLKSLPVETRQQVFQNLTIKSLFNCVLVDRHLCREAMPLLWRNPLVYGSSASRQAVNTYIECLLFEKQNYLINEGIPNVPVSATPFFEYPVFLQSLRTSTLRTGVEFWLFGHYDSQETQTDIVLKTLLELIFEKSHIKVLKDIPFHLQEKKFIGAPWGLLSFDPLESFQNLKELQLDFPHGSPGHFDLFLNNITSLCSIKLASYLPLQKINIKDGDTNRIIDLIYSQPKLYDLEISHILFSNNTKKILKTFNTSTTFLKSLVFSYVDFRAIKTSVIFKILASLDNIRHLEIEGCVGLEISTPFQGSTRFKNLEYLKYNNYIGTASPALLFLIVKASIERLVHLCIFQFTQISRDILLTILSKGSELRTLRLHQLELNEFDGFKKYFHAFPLLEEFSCDINPQFAHDERLFQIAELLPTTMKKLVLQTRYGYEYGDIHPTGTAENFILHTKAPLTRLFLGIPFNELDQKLLEKRGIDATDDENKGIFK